MFLMTISLSSNLLTNIDEDDIDPLSQQHNLLMVFFVEISNQGSHLFNLIETLDD